MKVTVVKPPHNYVPETKNYVSIFLAGSIEMDKAERWQDDVIEYIKNAGLTNVDEVVIYNPRRDNWDNSWRQSKDDPNFVKQVEWELEHIESSNVVAFYLQPGTNSPISLMELGIVSKDSFSCKKNVLVLCPDGFHRKGNVDITADWFDMRQPKDMDDFKDVIVRVLGEHDFEFEKKMEEITKKLK